MTQTKEKILEKIEHLESKRFYLAMKDRWTSEDYKRNTELWTEILRLKELLR